MLEPANRDHARATRAWRSTWTSRSTAAPPRAARRGPPADPRRRATSSDCSTAREPLYREFAAHVVDGSGDARGGGGGDRGGAALVRVTVPVPGRPYDVTIGAGVIAGLRQPPARPARRRDTAFVVADRAVADAWFAPLGDRARGPRAACRAPASCPPGEEAKTLQVYETPAASAGDARRRTVTTSSSRSGAARRGPRRVRGVHLHARAAVHPGPDDADRAGGRGDRRQDRGEPAGGQEPRGDLRAAASRSSPMSTSLGPWPSATSDRAGRGGEVRAHAGRGAARPAGADPGPVVATRAAACWRT